MARPTDRYGSASTEARSRRPFASDQAQILAIRHAAGSLQEALQRATATRAADATASEAIARLNEYKSEHVGLDRAGTSKPLRSAVEELAAAEAAVPVAVEALNEYTALADEREEAYEAMRDAEAQVNAYEAAQAQQAADAGAGAIRARGGDRGAPPATAAGGKRPPPRCGARGYSYRRVARTADCSRVDGRVQRADH